MDDEALDRIEADPRYRRLVRERSRLGWLLAGVMALAFFGFIALVAFDKALLAAPIGDGVTSFGIPIGFGLILLAIALTGLYVARANRRFDRLTRAIVADHAA